MMRIKKIVNERRQNIRSYFRKILLRLTVNKNDIEHLKVSYNFKSKWYGSSYGGFYLNPDLISEKSVVYSFGIGKDISFDLKLIKEHNCNVFAFDPTPKSIEYINTLPPNSQFHFHNFGISTLTKNEKFFLPANKRGFSGSMAMNRYVDKENFIEVKMKSLDDIAKELGHKQIDVLKMDIEGSEYDVIESILSSNIIIKQLLVEFHDRYFEKNIRSKRTVQILRDLGFEVFASSLNYEEVSFINTKYLSSKKQ